ncbi:DDE-domain-containing protein, partial [Cadophora sp. DSE1049]
NKRLNEAQEAALIWYIDYTIERGLPMGYNMIVAAARRILKISSVKPFKERLGKHWACRWIERMDGLGRYHALKTTPMDQKRKDCMSIKAIRGCFQKLDFILKKYNVHWKDIFNVDEIGFRVGCITSTTVITHKNIRKVYSSHLILMSRTSVTVIECISAAGYANDCYIIIPGKVYLEKMFDNNLPPDTKITASEKGYSSDDLAIKWLWHFHNQTKGRQHGAYRCLIFDGQGSHMTHEFISLCEDLKIIPFCLIAHSTHATQPLDVACFQSEKHWHGRAIEDRIRDGCNAFTKKMAL